MRKFISLAAIVAVLSSFAAPLAVAADVPTVLFADATTAISVTNGAVNNFNVAAGNQTLNLRVDYPENASLLGSTGFYKVVNEAGVEQFLIEDWGGANGAFPQNQVYNWNGRGCVAAGGGQNLCAAGNYKVVGDVRFTDGVDVKFDTFEFPFTITNQPVFVVDQLALNTTSGDTNFDPSNSGLNETLTINYHTVGVPTSVDVTVLNVASGKTVATFANQPAEGAIQWNGENNGQIVVGGEYRVTVTARKNGVADATRSENFNVTYANAEAANVNSVNVAPGSFDPDVADANITFTLGKAGILSVEILDSNGAVVKNFTDYRGAADDDYAAGSNHSLVWNGENNSGSEVAAGNYTISIVARNNFGAMEVRRTVTVSAGQPLAASTNAHIRNISCSPSTFEPADDDELECEFDIRVDNVGLKVYAVRGAQQFLIEEDEYDEGNDETVTWDGTDESEDEFVDEGRWVIRFVTRVGNTELIAEKTVEVEYERPSIDEFYLSKSEIDHEYGETVYALIRVEKSGVFDLKFLLDGDEDEEITEEEDIEDEEWVAMEVDADGYDYDDDLDVELSVYNEAMTDIRDKSTEALRLEEEDEDRKANVVNDFITPVITECNEGDTLELNYTLLNDADTVIAEIRKGESGSGSVVIDVFDLENQGEGEYSATFDCEDRSGKALSEGVYSYKIIARDGSSDTEVGIFIVGEGDSSSSSSNNDDNDDNGNSGSGVVVNNRDDDDKAPTEGKCAGYSDLFESNKFCKSVEWATDQGIIKGYSDGTARVFAEINRVETLKMIVEAGNLGTAQASGNLGFIDVSAGEWYMPYLKKGLDTQLVSGDAGKRTFRPGDKVNRVEAAKMVLELAKRFGNYTFAENGSNFADVNSGQWYYIYSLQVKLLDLIDVSGNNLEPGRNATRGEVIEMLYRMSEESSF